MMILKQAKQKNFTETTGGITFCNIVKNNNL
jgi:hypothetical protein